jgi:hypothetical protein
MNTIYKTTSFDRPTFSLGMEPEVDTVKPLGTFGGVIYKPLYRSNGVLIPSDTAQQLVADGLSA